VKWLSGYGSWKKRFAFLPINVGKYWYWWVPYWSRPGGECTEVTFTDPYDHATTRKWHLRYAKSGELHLFYGEEFRRVFGRFDGDFRDRDELIARYNEYRNIP
jgi:hypothetical protein